MAEDEPADMQEDLTSDFGFGDFSLDDFSCLVAPNQGCEEEDAADEDPFEEKVKLAKDELSALCVFCGTQPKKRNQAFCNSGCEADVRGAMRDAKSQGPQQYKAFQALRKRGGPDFVEAVMVYKSKCQGSGRGWRRPAFNWVRYFMLVKMESGVMRGTKSMFLSQGAFLRVTMEDENCSKEQATQMWFNEFEKCKGTKRMSADGKRILVKVEDYVLSYDQKSKSDNVELSTKQQANPSDADIAERLNWCGTDHEGFGSKFFSEAVGLDGDCFGDHAPNSFAKSSKPTQEQIDDAEASKTEKDEKKQKQIEERKAKAKDKPFEKDAHMSTLLIEFERAMDGLKEKLDTSLRNARNIMVQIEAHPCLPKFEKALDLLKKRTEALKAVVFVDGDAGCAHVDKKDEHVTAWLAYKNADDFKEWRTQSRDIEPCPKVGEIQCLSEVLFWTKNFELDAQEHVKDRRKECKVKIDHIKALAGKVNEQKGRVQSLFQRLEKDRVDKQAREEVDEAKKLVIDKKKAAAAAAKKKASPHVVYTVFSFVDKIAEIETVTREKLLSLTKMPKHPITCKDAHAVKMPDEVREALQKFMEEEFKDSDQYNKSGRGAKMLPTSVSATNKAMEKTKQQFGKVVKDKLNAAEQQYLASPWMFADSPSMKSCGPEFAFLGSNKMQLVGERSVICASYSEVKRVYVESVDDPDAKFTANDVKDFFALSDAATLARLGPVVCKTLIKPGDTLIVPWGWLVAEQSVNGQIDGGLRWLEISEESSLAFESLCDAVLPSDPSQVKSNSSLAFLFRLLNHLYKPDGKMVKAEGSQPPPGQMLCDSMAVKMEALSSGAKRKVADSPCATGSAPKVEQVKAKRAKARET